MRQRPAAQAPASILHLRPLPGLTNPHVQTIVASKLALSREPPATTHLVTLPDGDVIALEISTPAGWHDTGQTVLLLHGLCGCHRSPYMQRLAHKFLRYGIRSIRMNLRGCGSGKGLARYPYHSGRSADVLAVLEALQGLQGEQPQARITLVGFSLGGNIVLKLAGELGDAAPRYFQYAIAVCPPVDLVTCARLLAQPVNRFYNRYFTRLLCADVAYRQQCFPSLPAVQLPEHVTLYEFDELYTAPQGGFHDALDYYRQCSAAPLVPRITVPCHLLFAADDPIIAADVFDTVPLPAHIQITRTRYGGHLGFLGTPGSVTGYRAMDTQLLAWVMGYECLEETPRPEP